MSAQGMPIVSPQVYNESDIPTARLPQVSLINNRSVQSSLVVKNRRESCEGGFLFPHTGVGSDGSATQLETALCRTTTNLSPLSQGAQRTAAALAY